MVGLFCVFNTPTYAQSSFSELTQNRIGATLELTPAYPQPGDKVVVKLKQYMFDKNYSLVTWRLNGEVVLQGYGEIEYEFIAGKVGSLVALEVTVQGSEGGTAVAKKVFRVSDVAFVWEARTYTPPFFQGQPKLTYGSPAVIVAQPIVYNLDGEVYDTSDLLFTWMVGVKKVYSGLGVDSFVAYPNTPFDALEVTVKITDPSLEVRASHHILIPPRAPRLLLYEDDPTLGILYRSALPELFDLTKEELKIIAEPFYSSTQNRTDPELLYSWKINNETYDFPGSIVLRPEGGRSGITDVSLLVLNKKNFLERTQKYTSVRYSDIGAGEGVWTDIETNPL